MTLLLSDLPIPALIVDLFGRVNQVNEHFLSKTGYSFDQLSNKPCSIVINDIIDFSVFIDNLNSDYRHPVLLSDLKSTLLSDIQASTVSEGYLLVFNFSAPSVNNNIASSSNISDSLAKSYEALQDKDHYLSLYEKMNDSGFWYADLKNDELFWSLGIYRIHGVTEDSYQPKMSNYLNFYLEEEQEYIRNAVETAVREKSGFVYKGTIVRPDKTQVKVESIGEVELNEQGEVTSIIGVFRNITKQEQNIEKLKLLAIVNYTISVPIFFIDEHDNVVYQDLTPLCINVPSGLFSYLNFSIEEYLFYKNKAKVEGQVKESNVSFDQYNTVYDFSVTYEPDEKIYIWIVENVTEQFRKEQQQMISNRLTLLGNTFGNVSHDINNVLGVALGSVEMLELKLLQGEKNISAYVDRVKNAIDKGKSITERLLTFTRKQNVKIVQFDPNKDINDNQYLFSQLLMNTIKLKFKFSDEKCFIRFPQGEFINILLNIVLNAQDAIQEQGVSGEIQIITEVVSDNRFNVHIKDTGIGIDDSLLNRIFDPFYSSKSVNKGNGIGLANVYNTMYKHNGEIKVVGHCDLGGAQFTLIFKCEKVEPKRISAKTAKELNLLDKNVLVLDDEESIADFVAMYLETIGANVNSVNSKTELLDYLKVCDPIDIFITDMVLPDFTGKEAVDLVLESNPSVTIYSMSGYIGQKESNWQYPVLRKPFNSSELMEFIQ